MRSRAAIVLMLALIACRDAPAAPAPTPAPAPAPEPAPVPAAAPAPPALPHVATDWCTEGLTGLTESICYVLPDAELRAPRTLLIYLHGVIAPTGRMQAFVQGVVARAARTHGIVALMPRGRRGIGPTKTRDYWAWPTTAAAYKRYADELIAEWQSARATLEASLGPFERVWLAGSSNGAYFATVLALNGRFEADGYGALSGGMRGRWTKSDLPASKRSPFYVGYGSYDEAKTDPITLTELLREAGWPNKAAEHKIGHGAHDEYMPEMFAFWESASGGVK